MKIFSSVIPLSQWLARYQAEWLRFDLIAGLTAAAVVVPKALAFASIAGLPVQVGLYTAFVPAVIYVLLGSSRSLSVTTTTTLGILTAAWLSLVVPSGNAAELLAANATLTLLVGIILLLASFLRFGFVANFISEPVLTGFKAGIGVVIILDQAPKLFGVHFDKGRFVHNLIAFVRHLPETSIPTLLVGLAMIVMLFGLKHFAPRLPAPLVVVAAGIAASGFFGLTSRGVAIVGHIPRGFPAFTAPQLGLVEPLWPGALGIALMSFTETIAAGRAFARAAEPLPRPNQESLATGLANVGGALFGAMPAGGGTTQTAVNCLSGARTQLAALVTAAASVATMLVLAPLMGLMPQATLAAVVIVYSISLIKPAEFSAILRIRHMEFVWALIACAGVVLIGTLQGIVIAIIVSLFALSHKVANPPVYTLGRKPGTNVFRALDPAHPEDETFPGLLMIRVEGPLFFANAQRVREKLILLIEESNPKVVAFDFSRILDTEYSALKAVIQGEEGLRQRGTLLWLVALNPEVLRMVQRSSLGQTLGRERMLFDLETAVKRYHTLAA